MRHNAAPSCPIETGKTNITTLVSVSHRNIGSLNSKINNFYIILIWVFYIIFQIVTCFKFRSDLSYFSVCVHVHVFMAAWWMNVSVGSVVIECVCVWVSMHVAFTCVWVRVHVFEDQWSYWIQILKLKQMGRRSTSSPPLTGFGGLVEDRRRCFSLVPFAHWERSSREGLYVCVCGVCTRINIENQTNNHLMDCDRFVSLSSHIFIFFSYTNSVAQGLVYLFGLDWNINNYMMDRHVML